MKRWLQILLGLELAAALLLWSAGFYELTNPHCVPTNADVCNPNVARDGYTALMITVVIVLLTIVAWVVQRRKKP
jgi:hypothetical protein